MQQQLLLLQLRLLLQQLQQLGRCNRRPILRAHRLLQELLLLLLVLLLLVLLLLLLLAWS